MINDVLENFYENSKEEDTKQKYIARAKQLIKRAKRELGLYEDEELDVRQLVVWLHEHKKNIKPSCWRQYKNSVVYYLEIFVCHTSTHTLVFYFAHLSFLNHKNSSHKLGYNHCLLRYQINMKNSTIFSLPY